LNPPKGEIVVVIEGTKPVKEKLQKSKLKKQDKKKLSRTETTEDVSL